MFSEKKNRKDQNNIYSEKYLGKYKIADAGYTVMDGLHKLAKDST